MGSTLNEGDRLKLAKQLQQTLHTEQSRVIEAQKTHMNNTTTHLQQSIEQDLRLTRLDAMQQIDTVLRLHTSGKQDTTLEQQQLQLETLRLRVGKTACRYGLLRSPHTALAGVEHDRPRGCGSRRSPHVHEEGLVNVRSSVECEHEIVVEHAAERDRGPRNEAVR